VQSSVTNYNSLGEAHEEATLAEGATGMSAWDADDIWDAGNLGCGELVVELRRRIRLLQPRQTFHLIANDPGAIEDIPAWCRLTGHALKQSGHPHYLIQRKDV
jgi:tRNA 2-thiouridine synthesizing protein A